MKGKEDLTTEEKKEKLKSEIGKAIEELSLMNEIMKDSMRVTPIRELDYSTDIFKDLSNIFYKYKCSWVETFIICSSFSASIVSGYKNRIEISQLREDKKNAVLRLLNEIDNEIMLKLPTVTQRLFLADGLFGTRIYSDEATKELTKNVKKRFNVLKRNNFTCVYCGRKSPEVQLQVDHIIPRSKGGSDEESNLTCSCWECNLGKSNNLLNE